MKLENFDAFIGKHCETTATGCLLKHIGIYLSEPMLFGLGQGLGFIFWNMKTMDYPFLGGRIKPDILTHNLCENLSLKLEVQETSSPARAWQNVQNKLGLGQAVALKLDCYHLDYFTRKFHFAAHYVAMYGYDNKQVYLVDTEQQGGRVETSLESLALARNEKGPMASRNRSYTILQVEDLPAIHNIIFKAIRANAEDYLNPPIRNIGWKGILKTSEEIKSWFTRSSTRRSDFEMTAMLMERAGTGGSLFRNLYRDFLKESYQITCEPKIKLAYEKFKEIAYKWKTVSELFLRASSQDDASYINEASLLLVDISAQEREAFENLLSL